MGVKLGLLHHKKMLGTGVLEEVFEPKREEIITEWRKLPYEEFHNIFCFPDII